MDTIATLLQDDLDELYLANFIVMAAQSYSREESDRSQAHIWTQALSWQVLRVFDFGSTDAEAQLVRGLDKDTVAHLLELRNRFVDSRKLKSWPPYS